MKRKLNGRLSLLIAVTLSVNTLSTNAFAAETTDVEVISGTVSENESSTEISEETSEEETQERETESVYESSGLIYTFKVTNSWSDGYNTTVRIENTTSQDIEDWKFEMKYDGSISNIWDAAIEVMKQANM